MSTVEVDGGVFHVLAPDRLLLENERRVLAELQATAQNRLRRLDIIAGAPTWTGPISLRSTGFGKFRSGGSGLSEIASIRS